MLLADPLTEEIPVVIVSAEASPVQAKRLRAAGAAGYLTKPFDIDQLLVAVRSGGTPPVASDSGDGGDGVLDTSTVGSLHVLAANPAVGSAQIGEMLATFRHDADGNAGSAYTRRSPTKTLRLRRARRTASPGVPVLSGSGASAPPARNSSITPARGTSPKRRHWTAGSTSCSIRPGRRSPRSSPMSSGRRRCPPTARPQADRHRA